MPAPNTVREEQAGHIAAAYARGILVAPVVSEGMQPMNAPGHFDIRVVSD